MKGLYRIYMFMPYVYIYIYSEWLVFNVKIVRSSMSMAHKNSMREM